MTSKSSDRRSVRRMRVALWASLGSCVYCIRSAFRAAMIAWGLSSLIWASGVSGLLATLIGVVACALTVLWLAHLLAHAFKASGPGTACGSSARLSRRAVFVRAFAAAAVITSVPRLALGECNNEDAARCHSAELDCRSLCDRLYHQDERNHACRQQCASDAAACKAAAACE